MRVEVVDWEAQRLHVRTLSDTHDIYVPLTGYADGADWTSLTRLIDKGTQLCLVTPHETADGMRPDLIIVEPDYLVDISAIATCFEQYGETPLTHLLNRLPPSQISESIVLGNFAGQLLDEEVHAAADNDEECSYAQSVQHFFQRRALDLLAAGLSPTFHEQGRVQKENIRRAVQQQLPAATHAFDARKVMLEPSFFSPILGLQGRMDLLQLDYKVVIEQKAGKGSFPEPDPQTPVPNLKHYIQLLLYAALLRYNYGVEDAACFLLYSKYANALQPVGFSTALLRRAISLRNEIVAAERRYARGGLSVLTTLGPDDLNVRGTGGMLWKNYQRPKIEALLAPLHSCSPLERAYCIRMLSFVSAEHWHAKMCNGSKAEEGEIYSGLRLESPAAGTEGRVDRVVLSFCDSEMHDVANFREGDVVVLYAYAEGTEPDISRTMVFRGTIAAMSSSRISLSLRDAQTDAHVFLRSAHMLWAIEHDFLESSFVPLYRGVYSLLSAPQRRRDLLLLQRQPEVDGSLLLSGDYGAFNDLALRAKRARDFFLIVGPPGTGKTSFGLMTVVREELCDPKACMLLMAYTNRAVDEISANLEKHGIDYLRLGNRLSAAEAYRHRLLETKAGECSRLSELQDIVGQTRVFVGTTTAMTINLPLLQQRHYTLAVIDEASQLLEPHLSGLLAAQGADGESTIGRFVLIGDHKQLPAVVQQSAAEARVDEEALQAIGLADCRSSLFERLLRYYAGNKDITYTLTRQGRMHPEIADFPNRAFYGGMLEAVPCPHQMVKEPRMFDRRVQFIAVEPRAGRAFGKVNLDEAEVIARIVIETCKRAGEDYRAEQTIGVIVPYRNQIAAVRQALETQGDASLDVDGITIDTVERYQGSQRDVIVYGLTVHEASQMDFLTEQTFAEADGTLIDRKLNVALTRAREHLFIVGNPKVVGVSAVYAKLVQL